MKRILISIAACFCLGLGVQAQQSAFPLPEVPQVLVSPADRANYLAVHYWDRFDFKDRSLIDKPEITEQGFANFISIMPYVSEKKEAFSVFAKRMTVDAKMMEHMLEVSERYLFDAFSPVYDEELYLLLVEALLKQPALSLVQRERLAYQQEVALKNRVGQVATDFGFVLRNGKRMRLKDVKADYVLLYLNDPECDACQQIKEELVKSVTLGQWMKSGRMAVVSVCIEGKTSGWMNLPAPSGWMDGCDENRTLLENDVYDLRNLPAVYLLDGKRKVLLKNATLDRLEMTLKQLR